MDIQSIITLYLSGNASSDKIINLIACSVLMMLSSYIVTFFKTLDLLSLFTWSKYYEYTFDDDEGSNDYISDAVYKYISANNLLINNNCTFFKKNNEYRMSPINGTWYPIYIDKLNASNNILVNTQNNETKLDNKIIVKKTISLKSKNKEYLLSFIKRITYEYIESLEKVPNNNILYIEKDKNQSGIRLSIYSDIRLYIYSYILNSNKTFDNIFFNEKKTFLKVVDNFIDKQGVYLLPSVQHRLGIILYGPPGTGKTSIVKAMSKTLKRHVININMSKIKTNRDFFELLYNNSYYDSSMNAGYELSFSQKIYVIEDIDVISNIVKKRDNIDTVSLEMKMLENLESLLDEVEQNKNIQTNVQTNDTLSSQTSKFKNDDQLTLSGILNTLDGIIETPGRIIIFTTNNIDSLDPALLRPGRIDYKLFMGSLNYESLIQMLNFYNFKFTDEQLKVIHDTINQLYDKASLINELIPASIEQWVIQNLDQGQNDNEEKFIKHLKSISGKEVTRHKEQKTESVVRHYEYIID